MIPTAPLPDDVPIGVEFLHDAAGDFRAGITPGHHLAQVRERGVITHQDRMAVGHQFEIMAVGHIAVAHLDARRNLGEGFVQDDVFHRAAAGVGVKAEELRVMQQAIGQDFEIILVKIPRRLIPDLFVGVGRAVVLQDQHVMRQAFVAFAERHGGDENVARPHGIRIVGVGGDRGKIRRELGVDVAGGPERRSDG